jgi:hypothetical protein
VENHARMVVGEACAIQGKIVREEAFPEDDAYFPYPCSPSSFEEEVVA